MKEQYQLTYNLLLTIKVIICVHIIILITIHHCHKGSQVQYIYSFYIHINISICRQITIDAHSVRLLCSGSIYFSIYSITRSLDCFYFHLTYFYLLLFLIMVSAVNSRCKITGPIRFSYIFTLICHPNQLHYLHYFFHIEDPSIYLISKSIHFYIFQPPMGYCDTSPLDIGVPSSYARTLSFSGSFLVHLGTPFMFSWVRSSLDRSITSVIFHLKTVLFSSLSPKYSTV